MLQGKKIAICAFGAMVNTFKPLCEKYGLTLADMRFVKPLDTELVSNLAKTHDYIISIEEGVVSGGIGQELALCALNANPQVKTKCLGIGDHFVMEGTRAELLHDEGLTVDTVEPLIKKILG